MAIRARTTTVIPPDPMTDFQWERFKHLVESGALKESKNELDSEQPKKVLNLKCPKCGGIVDWMRSKSNGHRHAKCRTKNCIFFME